MNMVNARQAKSAREKAAEMRAEAARKEARGRAIAIVSAVVAVIVVAVGAGVIIQVAKHNQDTKTAAATAPPANLTKDAYIVGNTTAKVTVEVWEDFQCPACQNFESLNGAQLKKWAEDGTAKIEYHPVAILDRYSTTEYSTRALNAFAAVANAKPEAVEKFHSLLFTNQPAENTAGLPDSQLIDYAVEAGVDKAAVESAITSRKYEGWTKKVSDEFSKKGFTGTPTLVVNGKKVDDYSPDKLKAAVEAAKKA
jgi:protein-disulfide isomerase